VWNKGITIYRPQGDRKGPPSTPPYPRPYNDYGHDSLRVIVRAGVGWSGGGTLAVALRYIPCIVGAGGTLAVVLFNIL